MKNIIFLLLSISLCSCSSSYKINGIQLDRFTESTGKQRLQMVAGGILSAGVHWAGHSAYLEAKGIDWHQGGIREWVDEPISDGEWAAVGRAGFVAQLSVGAVMSLLWPDSFVTDGYDLVTFFEVATQPVKGWDMDLIDKGGNGNAEWAGYLAASTVLLVR